MNSLSLSDGKMSTEYEIEQCSGRRFDHIQPDIECPITEAYTTYTVVITKVISKTPTAVPYLPLPSLQRIRIHIQNQVKSRVHNQQLHPTIQHTRTKTLFFGRSLTEYTASPQTDGVVPKCIRGVPIYHRPSIISTIDVPKQAPSSVIHNP